MVPGLRVRGQGAQAQGRDVVASLAAMSPGRRFKVQGRDAAGFLSCQDILALSLAISSLPDS